MNRQIKAWINLSKTKYFAPQSGNDPTVLALEFEVNENKPDVILEEVFAQLNIDNAQGYGSLTSQQILEYHTKFPSMSVGDFISIDGQRFICGPIGWKHIGSDPEPEAFPLDNCRLCNQVRIIVIHGICADCVQGADPWEDLKLLDESEEK